MSAGTNPRMVDRTGIRGISTEDAVEAAGQSMKHKLIAEPQPEPKEDPALEPETNGEIPGFPVWLIGATLLAVALILRKENRHPLPQHVSICTRAERGNI
jgi:hypothetical protein